MVKKKKGKNFKPNDTNKDKKNSQPGNVPKESASSVAINWKKDYPKVVAKPTIGILLYL